MLSTKLKIATALLLAASVVAGASALAHQVFEAKPSEIKQDTGPQPAAKRAGSDIKEQARTDLYGDPLPAGAIARLGTVRFRHEGEATALAFTPDGEILVGYTNSGILIWDAATGKELRRLSVRMPSQASGLGISPDGTILAISESALGNDETKVSLWDLQSGKKTKTLSLPEGEGRRAQVNHLCFAPDGKSLAVSYTNQGKAVVFDLASGQVRASLGGRGAHFYNLAISPDSKTLAAAVDPNHSVELWDIVTGKLIRAILTLPEMSAMSFVKAIGFSPDGKMLAVGLMDRIILSNAADGKELGRLEVKMGQLTGLAFIPDGKKLVSGSEGDGKVRVWEVATGKIVSTLGGHARIGRSMALSPNGKIVALGTVGQTVRLWDVATGRELFTEYHGHDSQINSLAYSPDGKTLASGGDYRKILFWDTLSSQQKGILPGSARSLSFSADGKLLATVPADKHAYTDRVQIWDVAARKEASVITVPDTKDVKSAIFSPDGRKLFTLDWDFGGGPMLYYVRHWDVATGKQEQLWTIQHQTYTLSLVPDGKTVLAAVHRNFIIRNAETGREWLLRGPENPSVQTLLLSPDAKLLASGTNSDVRLWEVTTGKEIALLKGHAGWVSALPWSADGHMLASGDRRNNGPELATNQTVRLWDSATGSERARFGGFRVDVTALTFSPDGAYLLAGLADSTILIWEVPKRRP